MTNLEALKNSIAYPVADANLELILLKRGIEKVEDYTPGSAMELAEADTLKLIITAPSVSEGGYSISLSEKNMLMKMAESIYKKHGEPSPFAPKIRNASNRW